MPRGWETPYGTVSRAGAYSEMRRRLAAQRPPLSYAQPVGGTVDRWQYPTYQQTPWDPQPRPMPAPPAGGAPPISVPLGARTAPIETPWMVPGGTPILPPAQTPGGVGQGLEYLQTAVGAMGGAPTLGTGPYFFPETAPWPMTPRGTPPPGAQAPPGGGGGAGAAAGTPATTGAFGPFGSIEEWRNQFYAEHGRWPTDTDAQDAIASFGFLGQTGRSPTQQEWESRWQGGYGGTPQWGPIGGGGYGYPGYGGGWAPPPEPSWWGGNVFGEEGWSYLPTGPGQYPYPTPERGEQTEAPWYNIKDIKTFQQVDPQWRDWLQQAMQSQQQYWENPLLAPIQWMQPVQSEL